MAVQPASSGKLQIKSIEIFLEIMRHLFSYCLVLVALFGQGRFLRFELFIELLFQVADAEGVSAESERADDERGSGSAKPELH